MTTRWIRAGMWGAMSLVASSCQLSDDAALEPGPPVCAEHDNCDEDFCDQVLIEAGEFTMGADHAPHEDAYWPSGDERPVHGVALDAFCIDKYEVSLQRYESCVDAGVCSPAGLLYRAYETVVNHYAPECVDRPASCKHNAVNGKNYYQAEAYCEWVGGRLCTEAEWERAANGPGPDQRPWPWGDDPPTSARVNLPSTGTGYVERVDDYGAGASVEGVFNMAGNVYEWVADAYLPYEATDEGEVLDNPSYPLTSDADEAIGRGSCFFTEPEHAVTERSTFSPHFDWG